MTGFDFAPLFRTAIGFDRLAQLMDTAASTAEMPSYPPYNIEKTGEDTYRLTMAVAGFRPENLEMVVTDNNLVVSGRTSQEETKSEMLHRGIAGRAFEPTVRPRRPHRGRLRGPARRPAACGPEARGAGRFEAAPDYHWRWRAPQAIANDPLDTAQGLA